MDFEIQRSKFVNDKMSILLEKEYERKRKIFETQNEIKNSGILIEFLKEKIEFVYKNKKLDINCKLSISEVINEFLKWCFEKYSKKFDIHNYHIREIIKLPDFLGESYDDDSWIGIKLK